MKNTDLERIIINALEKIANSESCEFLTLPITTDKKFRKTDDVLKSIQQFRKDNEKDGLTELRNKSKELKKNSEKAINQSENLTDKIKMKEKTTENISNGTEVTIHDNQHKDGLEGKVIDYCKGYDKYLVQIDDFNAAYINRDNLKIIKSKLVLTKEFLIKDKISGKDVVVVAKITGDDNIVSFCMDNGEIGSAFVNNKDDIFSSQTEKYATYFYYEYMYEEYLNMFKRARCNL